MSILALNIRAQCYLTISPDSVSQNSCLMAIEDVVWENGVNTTTSSNNLNKATGGSAWNAGASSRNEVYGGGYIQTIINETNTSRMFGLNDTDTTASFTDINHAVYLESNGQISVYENGVLRGIFGTYSSGDTIRVVLDEGVVKYYQNGNIFYTSFFLPSYPLIADASFFHVNASLEQVTVANPCDSIFLARSYNPGIGSSWQWKINGINTGNNDSVYVNASLTDGDTLICILTPGAGGCSASQDTSNQIIIKTINPKEFALFSVSHDTSSGSFTCLRTKEDMGWQRANKATIDGNNLTKNSGNAVWNAGAFSMNVVDSGGYVETIINETNTTRALGLDTNLTVYSYADMDYGLYFASNGQVSVYENAVLKGIFGAYATGDTFRIVHEENVIKYYKNGSYFYTSFVLPSSRLHVSSAFFNESGTLESVTVSNGYKGKFTANINTTGQNAVYQWKLNGLNVGGNDASYTNINLSAGDTIFCTLNVDVSNCATTTFTSNKIIIMQSSLEDWSHFSILHDSSSGSFTCLRTIENIGWQHTNKLTINGNNLTKNSGNAVWNAGAFSVNAVDSGGYVETIINETNTTRALGLDTNLTAYSYADMDYGLYFASNGQVSVYENAVLRGIFGAYTTGDTFRIVHEERVIKYYKNGSYFYTSFVLPSGRLHVSSAFFNEGGTLERVTVGNGYKGKFTANFNTTGQNMVYQWKLNGVNVGGNSASYTNTNLSAGDTILCTLNVDVGNCDNTTITSNEIIITQTSLEDWTHFSILHDTLSGSFTCLRTLEDMGWQHANKVTIEGNNLTKNSGNSVWNAGAFSVNAVDSGGYVETIINETNTTRALGLDTNLTVYSYADMDYGLHFASNGQVSVYENAVLRLIVGAYATGDTFRVAYEEGVIKYYKNGSNFYTSLVMPAGRLYVSSAFYNDGSTLEELKVSNDYRGKFTANFNATGQNAVYQWKLNGINVGGNSTSYANVNLSAGDTIFSTLNVDVGNCDNTTLTSNRVVLYKRQDTLVPTLYISKELIPSSYSCQYQIEEISWDSTDLTLSGFNLSKTTGINSWNAGAFSNNQVDTNGYVETIVSETNTNRMFGLNGVNTTSSYTDIDFAFSLSSSGTLEIYENGISQGSFGSYAMSDTLRVGVEGSQVKYFKNQALIYTSATAPSFPLFVDLSIETVGGTLNQLKIGNSYSGRFEAFYFNAGANPTFQWKQNGINVGTNASVYINNNLMEGDTVTCEMIPDYIGCTNNNLISNRITFNVLPQIPFGPFNDFKTTLFSIYSDSLYKNTCQYVVEEVGWEHVNNQLSLNGTSLVKTLGVNNWDADGFSTNRVDSGGYVETVVNETNTSRAIGLSAVNGGISIVDIDYSVNLQSNGQATIYENGTFKGSLGNYSTGDTIRIEVDEGVVKYKRNGILYYESLISPTLPLYVDFSIFTVGGTLEDIRVGNGTRGKFQAYISSTSLAPNYQWRLNGVNVGGNSPTYVNTSLSAGDTISCELSTDFKNCGGDTVLNSNTIVIEDRSLIDEILFSISNDSLYKNTCQYAIEKVGWEELDERLTVTGNTITKTKGDNNWNADGFSTNSVDSGGYVEVVVNETNTDRGIGLSTTNGGVSISDIDYSVNLQSNGQATIYENGTFKAGMGIYSTGDTIRIEVDEGIVKYKRNGILYYESLITPTLPLYVDFSIFTVGGTLRDFRVGNGTRGKFRAHVSGTCLTPTYQWKLNGVDVGTNNPVYVNTALSLGDTISCDISIEPERCGGDTILTSNVIVIENRPLVDDILFSISNDSLYKNTCQYAVEEVGWGELDERLTITGNTITKTKGDNNWNADGFSTNRVDSGGYVEMIVNEVNTYRALGLSTTNGGVSISDIDYSVNLQNNGQATIYENGTFKAGMGIYSTGDTIRIEVDEGVVKYKRNGILYYESLITPTLPLYVDFSIFTMGGTLQDIRVGNGTRGKFRAHVSGTCLTPTYQWKLNGVDVGTNNPVYVNTALSLGDTISCDISIEPERCGGDTILTSNVIVIENRPLVDDILFSISNDSLYKNTCQYAVEEVGWGELDERLTITGNTITKTKGDNNWNADGFSTNSVDSGGYVEMIVNETNTDRGLGLSAINSGVSISDIDYSVRLQNNGQATIYENGTFKAGMGIYSTGDTIRIEVDEGVVKYKRNGILYYESLISPTLPLYVDFSIHTVGGTLSDIRVGNGTRGKFRAHVSGTCLTPTYQWKLNGVDVGTNSPTYVNTMLSLGDTISCDISIDPEYCGSDTILTSNVIVIENKSLLDGVLFSISNDSLYKNTCQYAVEEVGWEELDERLSIVDETITKTNGNNNWNANGFSTSKVDSGGYVEMIVNETNTERGLGLSTINSGVGISDIDYSVRLQSNGVATVYENGTFRAGMGSYSTGDTIRIEVDEGIVKYKRNGILYHESAVLPTLPLYVDFSIFTVGGTLEGIRVGNGMRGKFQAYVSSTCLIPNYQWRLNGVDVGINSPTYVNTTLNLGDTISCAISIDSEHCGGDTILTSNVIVIENKPLLEDVLFSISNDSLYKNTCQYAVEEVGWEELDERLTIVEETITKTDGDNNWDANGFSKSRVDSGGYVEMIVNETNTERGFGLSSADSGVGISDIDYSVRLQNNGVATVYENGTFRAGMGSYSTGDTIRIEVDCGVIKYRRNGTLYYESLVSPALPLHVDFSIFTMGGTLRDIRVGNGTRGKFQANFSGACFAPNYQWKLNGINVGTNASTYINTSLDIGDTITCELSGDFEGCGADTMIISNKIAIATPYTLDVQVLDSSNLLCGAALNNGSAAVTVTKGTPACFMGMGDYTYLWSSGSTDSSVTGLSAGTHKVYVVDPIGCSDSDEVTLTALPPSNAGISAHTDISCYGFDDGVLEVMVTGGTFPYTYNWSNAETDSVVMGLTPGNYSVTINDANNCETVLADSIDEPDSLIALILDSVNISCGGGLSSDGMARVTVTGGRIPYTYSWTPYGGNSDSAGNLITDTYTVIVTDSNGCSDSDQVALTEPPPLLLTVTMQTDATCFGTDNGQLNVKAIGGTPGYAYTWPGGQTDTLATNLKAGIYTISVQDSNNCLAIATDTIVEPDSLIALISDSTNLLCSDSSDGMAAVTVTGGRPAYTYSWFPLTGTDSIAIGLGVDTFKVHVIDSNGCSDSDQVILTSPSALTASITLHHDITCYEDSNGQLTVAASGGVGTYAYSWSNGDTMSGIVALDSGRYTVTITDSNGCQTIISDSIIEPDSLATSVAIHDVLCFGDTAGYAVATVMGGRPNYTLLWSNGSTQDTAIGLAADTNYSLIITDSSGCKDTVSFQVLEPLPLVVSDSVIDPICFGQCNGELWINPLGGTSPYTYLWNTGATTISIQSLCADTFAITVLDANQCDTTSEFILVSPPPLNAAIVAPDTICEGDTLILIGSGDGDYLWDSGDTLPIRFHEAGLLDTAFQLIVSKGLCADTAYDTVNVIPGLTITGPTLACEGDTVALTVTGGGGGYTWFNGDTSSILFLHLDTFGLQPYTVSATGYCTGLTDTHFVSVKPAPVFELNNDTTVYYGEEVKFFGDPDTLAYHWTSAENLTCEDCPDPVLQVFSPETFVVAIQSSNGCVAYDTIEVGLFSGCERPFVPTGFSPNNDGTNDVLIVKGKGYIDFSWSIFNRWGEMIHFSLDQAEGWDGTQKESDAVNYLQLEADVVVYKLQMTCNDGSSVELVGNVTLVKGN